MSNFISSSDLTAFQHCRQSWDFSSPLRQSLAPKLQQKALQRGTFVHALLEHYYKGDTRPSIDALGKHLQTLLDTEIERIAKLNLPDSETDEAVRQAVITSGNTAGIVSNYITWAKANDTMWTPIATETPFSVPLTLLDGREINVRGTMDTVFESVTSSTLFINDFKTCTTDFDAMSEYLTFYSPQARLYAWAAQKLYPRQRIAAVAFTLIKGNPPKDPAILKDGSLSKNKSQATTWAMYRRAIDLLGLDPDDYRDMRTPLEKHEFVRRITITFTKEELQRFEWVMQVNASQMLNPDVPIYPTPDFFGCQRCAFKLPCRAVQTGNKMALILHLRDGFGQSSYADRKYKQLEEVLLEDSLYA